MSINQYYPSNTSEEDRSVLKGILNTDNWTGIKISRVTKKQITLLQSKIGQDVLLKADRVLGVGRETVKLLSIDLERGTAQVEVPEWGEETCYLSMFVKLY